MHDMGLHPIRLTSVFAWGGSTVSYKAVKWLISYSLISSKPILNILLSFINTSIWIILRNDK